MTHARRRMFYYFLARSRFTLAEVPGGNIPQQRRDASMLK